MPEEETDWLENLERLWPFETNHDATKYLAGAMGYCLLMSAVYAEPESQQIWNRFH
jgi:hypothetical protein